ncbi:MAG TPA: peptidylprolyl isomerase [Acidimicrobiales bacterium]|nr:peptidylprolyl isomerase [Acidimicrobiales bacterium]
MKRLLLPLFAAAVAAGVLAASLTVSSDAATVNGTGITRSSLDGDLAAIAASQPYQCYLAAQVSLDTQDMAQLPPVAGAGGLSPDGHQGTFDSAFVDYWMNRMVGETVVAQLAASRHVTVSAGDLAAARQEYAGLIDGTFAALAQSGLQPACGLAPSSTQVLSSLPASFVAGEVRSVALADGLAASAAGYRLGPPSLRAYFEAHRSSFDTLCVEGFEEATEAAAAQVRGQVQAGLPFAQAAPAGSLQQACLTPTDTSYRPIAAAVGHLAVGQVSEPVAAQGGGAYLFVLTGRRSASLRSVGPVLRQTVVAAGEQRLQAMLAAATRRAQVTIDPRYGRWTSSSVAHGVAPAPSPPASSVPAAGTSLRATTSGVGGLVPGPAVQGTGGAR